MALDDFTGTNGQALSARTGWTSPFPGQGGHEIQSNQCAPSTPADDDHYDSWDTTYTATDHHATVTVATVGGDFGPSCRGANDEHTCISVQATDSGGTLYSIVLGSFSSLGSVGAVSAGSAIRIVSKSGGVEVFIDDVSDLDVSTGLGDSRQYIGLTSYNSTATRFDDFDGGEGDGASGPSSGSGAVTDGQDTSSQIVPMPLKVTTPTATQAVLDWEPYAPGAVAYDVLRDGSPIAFNVLGTSYSDTAATPGADHTYRVRPIV